MNTKLVIFQNNTYEQVGTVFCGDVLLRKPFSLFSSEFWAPVEEVTDYPRTNDYIVRKWIPDCVNDVGHEPEVYLLEIISALLTPKFLLAPKESGVYMALWMDETDHLQVAWILYNPNDSTLTESDQIEGYNTFLIHKKHWVPLKYYIGNEKFRYLRFIPFNIGYTYMYLLHLIESEHFTREEVEQIWHRDRNTTNVISEEFQRDQD